EEGEDQVIGDEPGNTGTDQEPSEEAVLQGEGRARLSFLPALRQDLPGRHSAPRLCAGPRQCGSAGSGRRELRGDCGGGRGRMAGGPETGTDHEDVPAGTGAACDDPEAGGR